MLNNSIAIALPIGRNKEEDKSIDFLCETSESLTRKEQLFCEKYIEDKKHDE